MKTGYLISVAFSVFLFLSLSQARKEVELNAGFEVKPGASFEINVNPNHVINYN
jgi:hypothetical protein